MLSLEPVLSNVEGSKHGLGKKAAIEPNENRTQNAADDRAVDDA